jgi:hypothetical protein
MAELNDLFTFTFDSIQLVSYTQTNRFAMPVELMIAITLGR